MSKDKTVRLRLVRANIQFDIQVDDGKTLSPIGSIIKDKDGNPAVISAAVDGKEWPTYATNQFLESLADLEKAVNQIISEQEPGKQSPGK